VGSVDQPVTSLRTSRVAAGLLGALLAIAGCAGTPALPETTNSVPCVAGRLVVSAGYDGVRVRNPSAAPCRFAGRYPVTMRVWRLRGAGPPIATGPLPGGATYFQPFIAGPGNGCPPGAERSGALAVSVEGIAVPVPLPGRRAYEITRCVSFTAGTPRIER
jgi:hypothetical protein